MYFIYLLFDDFFLQKGIIPKPQSLKEQKKYLLDFGIFVIIKLMAFVSETQRKINEISKTMNPLGPGQYFKEESHQLRKQCAPFQSTSRRRSFLDVQQKQAPGPGQYETIKPFIQPNIKTVSNSQSIIVKINSTGTAQFKSVVQRFGMRDHEVPGPGQYPEHLSISPKKKSLSQRSIKENKMINQLKQMQKSKNYPTIPEKIRGLTDAKKEEVNPEGKLGPAFYNPSKRFHLNSTSTVWGKDRVKRFSLDSKSEVGPGKYNPVFNPVKPQDKIHQPSSHFKSATVRTYFDSLIYNTNQSETAKVRENTKFKSKGPAPGQYETNVSSIKVEQKPFSLQFFGSTVERFTQNINDIPDKKSKSFYNIKSDIGKNRSFNKSEHAFMSDTMRRPQFLKVNEKQKNPGPGHYRQIIKVEKKLRGNKPQKFGTSSKRMFQIEDEIDVVGPGKYEKDSSKSADGYKNSRFGQVNEVGSNFKSSTNRDCFGLSRVQKNPFAEYDVSHYDLSKKIQKQKNFLQNLKKIDVEKAAFQSSHSRFPHYESKSKDNGKNQLQEQKKQELKIKQEAEKVREMILEANQTQVKEVKKNHFGTTQRFMGTKKAAPPVGQYNVRSSWEKRSYNVKYSK